MTIRPVCMQTAQISVLVPQLVHFVFCIANCPRQRIMRKTACMYLVDRYLVGSVHPFEGMSTKGVYMHTSFLVNRAHQGWALLRPYMTSTLNSQ